METEADILATEVINRLKLLPRSELVALPSVWAEVLAHSRLAPKITTYHELMSDGRHLVVAQAIVPKWWGISSDSSVKGFTLSADDRRIDADEQLLWSFT